MNGFIRVEKPPYSISTDPALLDLPMITDYLARWLMEVIMSHPDLQGLRRFSLATRDAHGLYEKFGFTPLARPEAHMEIMRRGIYLEGKKAR